MARSRLSRRGGGARFTWGAAATALIALIGLALVFTRGEEGEDRWRQAADDTVAAGGGVGGGMLGGVARFGENASLSFGAAGRVRELEAENARLARWRELALTLAERTERYEALLKMPPDAFGEGIDPAGAIGARLILDSGGPFRRTLLVNAGYDHGVRRGYLALNELGLVGRVVSVGRRSARVLMLDDYNSRVPVVSEQSRLRGVLIGDVGSRAELEVERGAAGAPRLDFLVGAATLRAGERIVTSGDGGLYPRGILVGWAEPTREGEGWRVRLATANAPIDYVRLAPFAPPQAPELEPVDEGGSALLAAAAPRPTPTPTPAPAPPERRQPAARPPLPPPAAASELSPQAAAEGVPEE